MIIFVSDSPDTAIIIHGLSHGKSSVARLIANEISGGAGIVVSRIDEKTLNPDFSNCDDKTSVVIIEDCPGSFQFESVFNHISEGVYVNDRFWIRPKFIFTTTRKPEKKGVSFESRFDFVEIDQIVRLNELVVNPKLLF